MRSGVQMWPHAAISPLTAYAGQYRMIAMDQRNTGRSSGPLEPGDPWAAYDPTETGREIAALTPAAEVLEPWKDDEHLPAATEAVGRYLREHTPA